MNVSRALTVKQPWASRIVKGEKRFEIRSQRTHYRGRLLITSSAKPKGQGPAGATLGYVTLTDCIPYLDTPEHLEASAGVPWRVGLWAWVMEDAKEEPNPQPIKGRLGIWHLSPGETTKEES